MGMISRQGDQTTDGPMVTPLEREIREMVRSGGRITFREFMELALYHPAYGYYNSQSERIGRMGDFLTSPETHPVFGALIARQMEQMWNTIGCPNNFTVVEIGAGSGSLCAQVLQCAKPKEFRAALRYIIVERSAELVRRQKERLHTVMPDIVGKISWFEPTDACAFPSDVIGCFIANELIDAFPVHRVTTIGGELMEIYVGEVDGELIDVIDSPSTPELMAYFEKLGIVLPEGSKAEVNLAALECMRSLGTSLARGFAVIIDYGYPAEDLYSPSRPEGTLLCYHRHTLNANPYARIGQQDITTHVDFTSLIKAGAEAGLDFVGLVSQREFLLNLGLEGFMSALEQADLPTAAQYDNKFAMRRLISPDGLGKFNVLVLKKGIGEVHLDCFNPCNDRKRALITGKEIVSVPLADASSSEWVVL